MSGTARSKTTEKAPSERLPRTKTEFAACLGFVREESKCNGKNTRPKSRRAKRGYAADTKLTSTKDRRTRHSAGGARSIAHVGGR
jgi:hypothetical protein